MISLLTEADLFEKINPSVMRNVNKKLKVKKLYAQDLGDTYPGVDDRKTATKDYFKRFSKVEVKKGKAESARQEANELKKQLREKVEKRRDYKAKMAAKEKAKTAQKVTKKSNTLNNFLNKVRGGISSVVPKTQVPA